MIKPIIRETPLFPSEDNRFKLYKWINEKQSLLILQDTWQFPRERLFMSISGEPFKQVYSVGYGLVDGFERNRLKLILKGGNKRIEPCEMDIRVNNFSLHSNDKEKTCVLISGNRFFIGEVILGDKNVEKALSGINIKYEYLPENLYEISEYLGFFESRLIFLQDIVKFTRIGYLVDNGKYEKLENIERKIYRDGGTVDIKFTIQGKTHSVHLDTPFKGDKREFLFDDIFPVEILDPKLEELNNFSELTGIKLADPFGKRCLK